MSIASGTSDVTVLYTKNGQNVAVDYTSFRVNATTAGPYGSLTITTPANARQLRVGETLLFQVFVRDVNGGILTAVAPSLIAVAQDGTILRVERVVDPTGNFYSMKGLKSGITIITATATGVATSLQFVVTP